MAPPQVYSAATPSPARDVEPGDISHRYGDGKFSAVTLKGHPVNKSRTGGNSAVKYIYALVTADYTAMVSVTINFVFYLYTFLHQSIATSATITSNYTGTCFLVTVLGGFLADSYLGHYVTIIIGGIIQLLGVALLVFTATYSGLQPPPCTPTLTASCPPAGGKYMAPVYVALYTIALGTGFVKSSTPALGAEQFDEADPVEKRKSVHYFIWYYFAQNIGILIAFSLSVYILDYVGKGWGFGWLLIFYSFTFIIFLAGTPQYRHKKVGGSFITRIVQVTLAALRKRKWELPEDASRLYDAPVSGGWLRRSSKLRFLDKASIMEKNESITSSWRLPGVTQVEETKRIFQLLPVWASTCLISVIFSQVVTFTATQGATLDRTLTKHFVIPPASLGVALVLISLVTVPIYDKLVMPILRKVTKNPYGVSPLKRIGIAAVSAILAMIVAALVERKRLRYIRELGYTQAPFFALPMSMWWLLPQYFFSSFTELFLFVAQYEFFYHEVSDGTRSIGSTFLFSSLSLGYFCSSVLVNVTNHVTKHHKGGAWLVARLNNGGLENYFWLLAVILSVNLLAFLVAAHFYKYNYTMFLGGAQEETDHASSDKGFSHDNEFDFGHELGSVPEHSPSDQMPELS